MPFGLGIWEMLILAGVLVLLFGAKCAPAMARRLGTGVREMKDAVTDMDPRSVFDAKDEPAKVPPKQLPPAEVVPAAALEEAVPPESGPAPEQAAAQRPPDATG